MKIARYLLANETRVGVVDGDRIHPFPEGTTINVVVELGLEGLLDTGAQALRTSPAVPLADVTLVSPVEPRLLRDFTTFEQHVEGMMKFSGHSGIVDAFYEFPPFYTATPHVTTGPGAPIPVPPGTQAFDFELELAAVIGRGGRDFDQAGAREAIIGYTIFNDWSARDVLGREVAQWLGPAKGKDTVNTFGPYLVTADEFDSRRDVDGFLDLQMSAFINGERVGVDRSSSAAWSAESCVQLASRGSRLLPGDVIGLGTCGAGCLAEFWGRLGFDSRPALRPGDVVRLEVEGIGSLENTVVEGVAVIPLPAGRRILKDREVVLQ